jgi:hypothetical protein
MIQQSLFTLGSDIKFRLSERIRDKESKNKVVDTEEVSFIMKEIKSKLEITKVNDFSLQKPIKESKGEIIDISSAEQMEYVTTEVKVERESNHIVNKNNLTALFMEDRSYQQDEEEINRVMANLNTYKNTEVKSTKNTSSQIENFLSSFNANSKYQKNIINALDGIAVAQYSIHSSVPLDPVFFDVICINCYDCVKFSEVDSHGDTCLMHEEENYVELDGEEDYNARIYKLHESLKKKQDEIFKTADEQLIMVYEEIASLVYEILINNNSIEELDLSIAKLNEIVANRLNNLNSFYKFTFVIFGKRLSQLVYTKLKDMEKILLCVGKNVEADEDVAEDSLDEETPENAEQIQMLKWELANLEQQTLNAKVEIEQWKKESKMLENMMRRPNLNNEMLSDIVSDVLSRRDESVNFIFKINFNFLV